MSKAKKPAAPQNAPVIVMNAPVVAVLEPLQCVSCGTHWAMRGYDNRDLPITVGNSIVGNAQAVLPNTSGMECFHCHDGYTDPQFTDQWSKMVDELVRFSRASADISQLILL